MKHQDYKSMNRRSATGENTLLLVKEPGKKRYSIFLDMVTVPNVFGEVETVEFDTTGSSTKGKIKGKRTLENKDFEFFNHRDNIYRAEQLKDKMLDFLYYAPGGGTYHFSGTFTYRANDATASDILTCTGTIVPATASDEPIIDCRDLIEETLLFMTSIPDELEISDSESVVQIVSQVSDFTITATCDNSAFAVTATQPTSGKQEGSVSIKTTSGVSETAHGIVFITISKEGYASWTTTIAIENEI